LLGTYSSQFVTRERDDTVTTVLATQSFNAVSYLRCNSIVASFIYHDLRRLTLVSWLLQVALGLEPRHFLEFLLFLKLELKFLFFLDHMLN
jgi:hypothetical protein